MLAEIVACRKKSRRIRSRMVDCTVPGDRIEVHVHAEFYPFLSVDAYHTADGSVR